MTQEQKIEALKEMVDCLEEMVQRRLSNTNESRAEALEYITTYLEKMRKEA